jgi:site-specific recombinase XerD
VTDVLSFPGGYNQRTTFETALRDFLEVHRVNRRSSGLTVRNYSAMLARFVEWLASQGVVYVDELTIKHLRSYVGYLQTRPSQHGYPLADTTVQKYAVVVGSFCHWLVYEELLDKRVVEKFDIPKSEDREIPALSRDDLDKLLEACEEGDKKKLRLRRALTARNRAIVSVLFDAGIRRAELIGLRLGDVDREMRLLYVRRKGGKWQQVPISYEGFKPLHEYITKYRPYLASLGAGIGSKRDDPVFLGSRGEPLTYSAIGGLFDRLAARVDINKPVYAHQGRRYMATTQLDAGRNPLDVQRQMGHRTLLMTNRYYSQTTEGLRRSHESYSPLRKRREEERSSGLGSGYYEE